MTYSIVAVDAAAGTMGVAVQSHYFGVGAIVPCAEAGTGVVATQSLVRVAYGPGGLAALRGGLSAAEALARCLADDPESDVRQVACADARGGVAVHTGRRCIAEAGHEVGENFTVQANLMHHATVWGAMANAFRASTGALARRLLAALEAAEAEGGDIRGRQSAALVVVGTGPAPDDAPRVSLRVDDHAAPLTELARLLDLHDAYKRVDEGDALVVAGRLDEARAAYGEGARLARGLTELRFWEAVALLGSGHGAEARAALAHVFTQERRWTVVLARLPAAGLLDADQGLVQELAALGDPDAPW